MQGSSWLVFRGTFFGGSRLKVIFQELFYNLVSVVLQSVLLFLTVAGILIVVSGGGERIVDILAGLVLVL